MSSFGESGMRGLLCRAGYPLLLYRAEKRIGPARQASIRLALAWIETLVQPAPAVDVVVLQCIEPSRVFRHALAEARLEHEGERVGELHGLQPHVARMIESVAVGPV